MNVTSPLAVTSPLKAQLPVFSARAPLPNVPPLRTSGPVTQAVTPLERGHQAAGVDGQRAGRGGRRVPFQGVVLVEQDFAAAVDRDQAGQVEADLGVVVVPRIGDGAEFHHAVVDRHRASKRLRADQVQRAETRTWSGCPAGNDPVDGSGLAAAGDAECPAIGRYRHAPVCVQADCGSGLKRAAIERQLVHLGDSRNRPGRRPHQSKSPPPTR